MAEIEATIERRRTEAYLDMQERARRRDLAKRIGFGFPAGRVRDLRAWFSYNYGIGELPDDDAGHEDFELFAAHVVHLKGDPLTNLRRQRDECAPWSTDRELDELLAKLNREPQFWKADELAHLLGLTFEVRQRLGIKTIGSIDTTKEQRAKLKYERKKTAAKEKRKRVRAKRHFITAGEPWKVEGICRRTWFARRAKMAKKD